MSDRTRLAIPSNGNGGMDAERSGHFGHCDCFTLVDLEDGAVIETSILANPPHVEGGCLAPVSLLATNGVNAMVVAGMGGRPLAGFQDAGITVYFENMTPIVGDVVAMVSAGTLPVMDSRNACSGH